MFLVKTPSAYALINDDGNVRHITPEQFTVLNNVKQQELSNAVPGVPFGDQWATLTDDELWTLESTLRAKSNLADDR